MSCGRASNKRNTLKCHANLDAMQTSSCRYHWPICTMYLGPANKRYAATASAARNLAMNTNRNEQRETPLHLLRSRTCSFSELRNSRWISHFAALFIEPRPKVFTAKATCLISVLSKGIETAGVSTSHNISRFARCSA